MSDNLPLYDNGQQLQDPSGGAVPQYQQQNFAQPIVQQAPVAQQMPSIAQQMPSIAQQMPVFFAQLDPMSIPVKSTMSLHKSHTQLNTVANNTGETVYNTACHGLGSQQGSSDPNHFLEGLFLPGERVELPPIADVAFDKITFQPHSDEARVPTEVNAGVLVITNMRLIFLSVSGCTVNRMTTSTPDIAKPMDYSLNTSMFVSKSFFPLSVSAIKSVRMQMETGVNTSATITSTPPCITFCPWICLRSWQSTDVSTSIHSVRKITLSVELPPWSDRVIMDVWFNARVSPDAVKNVVGLLQEKIIVTDMSTSQA